MIRFQGYIQVDNIIIVIWIKMVNVFVSRYNVMTKMVIIVATFFSFPSAISVTCSAATGAAVVVAAASQAALSIRCFCRCCCRCCSPKGVDLLTELCSSSLSPPPPSPLPSIAQTATNIFLWRRPPLRFLPHRAHCGPERAHRTCNAFAIVGLITQDSAPLWLFPHRTN